MNLDSFLRTRRVLPISPDPFGENVKAFEYKGDYLRTLKQRRRTFLDVHFGELLTKYFNELTARANKILPCNCEMTFEIPENLDINKTEAIITSYFEDLGYSVITEPHKDNKIIFTVT